MPLIYGDEMVFDMNQWPQNSWTTTTYIHESIQIDNLASAIVSLTEALEHLRGARSTPEFLENHIGKEIKQLIEAITILRERMVPKEKNVTTGEQA